MEHIVPGWPVLALVVSVFLAGGGAVFWATRTFVPRSSCVEYRANDEKARHKLANAMQDHVLKKGHDGVLSTQAEQSERLARLEERQTAIREAVSEIRDIAKEARDDSRRTLEMLEQLVAKMT